MKLAHLCFVVAGVSALSAASLSLAQVTYPNEWCFSTPRSACQNMCGCPIPNTPSDFCSGGLPTQGLDTFPYFYCASSSNNFTCTSPTTYCGGSVVSCVDDNGIPCSCCGYGVFPPCNGKCGWWCAQPCKDTDKDGACGGSYGCTTP